MQTPPEVLPANFNGWDQNAPPQTLPADFNGWDAPTKLGSPNTQQQPDTVRSSDTTIGGPYDGAVAQGEATRTPRVNPAQVTPDQALTLSAQADCSLFTQRVFGQAGVPLPRTAITQYKATPLVEPRGKLDPAKLQPGDLVFFDNGLRTPFNTSGKQITDHWGDTVGYINHVGIYQGNGKIIHDPGNGTVAVVPLSHFSGMKFMGATRPAATPQQPPQYGIAGSPDPREQYPHVPKGGFSLDNPPPADMRPSAQAFRRASAVANLSPEDRAQLASDEAKGKVVAARAKTLMDGGMPPAQAMKQAAQENSGTTVAEWQRMSSANQRKILDFIKPVTRLFDAPVSALVSGVTPLGAVKAAGGPDLVGSQPVTGFVGGTLNLPADVMADAGIAALSKDATVTQRLGALANIALKTDPALILKGGIGAVKMMPEIAASLKELSIAATQGPRSAAFVRALRQAQGSGVDLEALASSLRDHPEFRNITQVVSRETAPPIVSDTSGGMAEMLKKNFEGPTVVPAQFAGLQRESYIRQWGMTRQEGLINAMREQIASTKGAGRQLGPMVRQLEAAQAAGELHPAVRDEAGAIWDKTNPEMAGSTPSVVTHVPETPTPTEAPKFTLPEPPPGGAPAVAPVEPKPDNSVAPMSTTAVSERAPALEPPPVVPSDQLNSPKLEDITAAAERIGAELDPKNTTTWAETADKAVRDGHVRNALSEAMSLKPNKVTKEHIFGWGIRFQQVERELNAAMASGDEAAAAALNHEGETILNAIKAANSEAGARLASANALLTEDYGRFALRIKGRKAVGGRALTAAEQAPLDQAATDLEANKQAQQAVATKNVQAKLDAVPPSPPKRYLVSEETFKKAQETLRNSPVSSGLSPEQIAAAIQIVGYHIETGVRTVGELVTKLKDHGLSDADAYQYAHDGIQSYTSKMNAGRTFGEGILTEGKNAIQSSDIAALRKELDALKLESKTSQNTAAAGTLTKLHNQVKQLEGMQGKPLNLDEYKALRDKINETSRELNAGRGIGEDFLSSGSTKGGGSGIVDPEIAKLRTQAEQIKIDANRHIKALQAIEDYNNLGKFEKFATVAQDWTNLPRTMKASIDFSAPLRQGIFFSISHPGLTLRATTGMDGTAGMFRAFADKGAYEEAMAAMRTRAHWELARDSKLFIADAEAPLTLNAHEELFASRIAGKIPGISNSERAYALFLNKQRFDMFSYYADAAEAMGKPLSAKEGEVLANFINVATGRGTGRMADAASNLSTVFFAPRYTYSRIQLAFGGPLIKSIRELGWTSPVTKTIAKEYAKVYGTIGLTIGALKAAGANISLDPHSTDFGKLVVGNTRISLFGGLETNYRLLAQVMGGRVDKNGKWTAPSMNEMADILGRSEIAYKLNPILSTGLQAKFGKDFTGQPYGLDRAAVDLFSPLSIQQGWDSVKDNGPMVGGVMVLADVFGAAVNVQEPKSDPFGGPYDPKKRDDPVFKELARIGYAHPIKRDPSESQAEFDSRRQDFEQFAYPDIKAQLADPDFQALTKKEKQDELKTLFSDLSREYSSKLGPGYEAASSHADARDAKAAAEIEAQRKAGIH